MNPMTQEPDGTVEAVVLKEIGDGYTLAQRGSEATDSKDIWFITGSDIYHAGGFAPLVRDYHGWWPLDFRSVIDE